MLTPSTSVIITRGGEPLMSYIDATDTSLRAR